MDEQEFERKAGEGFDRVIDLFEDVDPDQADVEQQSGDVVTIELPGHSRVVLNTQRPARQLWLAGGRRAWHFSFDPDSGQWLDDRSEGAELFAVLRELCGAAGVTI